ELAVDHRVPPRAGIGEVDRDLGVLDSTRGAGVLALHADGCAALLQISGLVASVLVIVQQFFRGRSANSPNTNPRTRRRVSTRPKRPAIRSSSLSTSAAQSAASTLWPTATA